MDEMKDNVRNAVEILYPKRSKPALGMSLPLESYTGTYYHPGFLNMTIDMADPSKTKMPNIGLTAQRPEFSFASTNEFEHVSGEYWVVYSYFTKAPNSELDFGSVYFSLGSDGKVASVGIEWGSRPSGEGEGLILFEKIA